MKYLVLADDGTVKAVDFVWSEKYILYQPADGYASDYVIFTRNAALKAIVFAVKGAPSAATTITIKLNSTTLGTISLSATGITVWTPSGTVNITARDLLTYTVTGAGLSSCSITTQAEAVNR